MLRLAMLLLIWFLRRTNTEVISPLPSLIGEGNPRMPLRALFQARVANLSVLELSLFKLYG
jgi:hypothetical protein